MDKFFSGKRVFLTGATGFKGAWLTLWLAEMGAQVTAYSLAPETQRALFLTARVAECCRHHEADIRDLPRLQAAMHEARPELVLHLAAQALVRRSYADPVDTWSSNVLGTVHVLEACRRLDALQAVVVVSSDKCYAPPSPPRPLQEDDRLGGRDPYSASKAAVELATISYAASFSRELPPVASARAGNVIGGGDFGQDRIVPDCVRAMAEGRPVVLRHPGHIRPWQHVLEPLAGYLQLCVRLATDPAAHAGHGAWNFGPDEASHITVQELAQRLTAYWGPNLVQAASAPSAEPETAALLLDNRKAKAMLGWRPLLDIDDTLRWTAHWYARCQDAAAPQQLCLEQIRAYHARLTAAAPAAERPQIP